MNIHAKRVLPLPVYISFLILVSLSAYAVSITPGKVTIDFQPNAQFSFDFTVSRSELINVFVDEGDLQGCMKLIDSQPNGSGRTVTVIITLPDRLEKPGENRGHISAREINLNPSAISALAEIRAPIVVKVPYPGYYAEMTFEPENVNEGEPEDFKLTVINLGTNQLERVYAVIDVYDDNSKLKSVTTDTRTMASNTQEIFETRMSTTGMKPGPYKAVATLYYDGGNTLTKEASFNIGTRYVQINGHSQEVEQGGIKKFDFEVESMWNSEIENVYGKIIFGGAEVQTAGYPLLPWEKKNLSGYIDTSNHPYGEHDVRLEVYYEGETTVKNSRFQIIPPIEEATPPETEQPTGELVIRFTTTTILISIIVLLVIIDLAWILLKHRGAEPVKTRKR